MMIYEDLTPIYNKLCQELGITVRYISDPAALSTRVAELGAQARRTPGSSLYMT